ncbi:MAG: glutamyl-tRNA reductase [Caldilineaceae bacterium]|nr:glutamyl-tRNA reductase [Caldilineaceae bacterium]
MSSDGVFFLGLSHHTTPVELREQVALSASSLLDADRLHEVGIGELYLLSTCNRFEIFAYIARCQGDSRQALHSLLEEACHAPRELESHLTFRAGTDASTHLMNVAAGLDSMVLGENQVLGQVTDAYMQALENRTIGPVLSSVVRAAIRTGKRVRSQTAISRNPASISSVAINMAEGISGDLRKQHVVVIGAGEMGQLALKSLEARGLHNVTILNRTPAHAERLATRNRWRSGALTELPLALKSAGVVISATTSAQPLITAEMATTARQEAIEDHPLVLIDLAVPRDIDPVAGSVAGIHLIDIDDLRGELDGALAARRREVPKVKAIIADELAALEQELQALSVRPLVVDLRQRAEEIRQHEVERTLRYLEGVDSQTLEHIQHMSRALVNKLLHEPTTRLKALAGDGQAKPYAEAMRALFDLEINGKDRSL